MKNRINEAETKVLSFVVYKMINDKTQKSGTNQFKSAAEN